MAHGSFMSEVEMARLQRGLAMCLESVVYNMAATLGSRATRSPWAVKDQVWVVHQLIEMVAAHQVEAAEVTEVNTGAIDNAEVVTELRRRHAG
jgi:hypothetical protein